MSLWAIFVIGNTVLVPAFGVSVFIEASAAAVYTIFHGELGPCRFSVFEVILIYPPPEVQSGVNNHGY
jgi:hypothetical protein